MGRARWSRSPAPCSSRPIFLLSGLAGEMADRFDKALLARRLKGAEIGVAGVAALGFLLPSVPLLFAALAGFGTVSALFGPVKYAILPDHLPRERLTAANAFVEFATFAAILGGTIAGGLAVGGTTPSWLSEAPWCCSPCCPGAPRG